MSPTLSIVMPFYNEFSFLDQSIGSALGLGCHLKELILVNDGANEASRNLLEPFAAIPQVRVLHNPSNVGAAMSRNRGLRAASGDYVMLLDADDFVSPKGLVEALEFAAKNNSQIVHLPTYVTEPRSNIFYKHFRDQQLFGRRIDQTCVSKTPETCFAVANWSFLFSRPFVEDNCLQFDAEQRLAEDHLFAITALYLAERVSVFDRWCHVWRRRGGSLTTSVPTLSDQQIKLKSLQKSLNVMDAHHPRASIEFQRDYAFGLMRFVSNWDFLPALISVRHCDETAARLLDDLAVVLDEFDFDDAILHDRVLQGTQFVPLRTQSGRVISFDDAGAIIKKVQARDWEGVSSALQPECSSTESRAAFADNTIRIHGQTGYCQAFPVQSESATSAGGSLSGVSWNDDAAESLIESAVSCEKIVVLLADPSCVIAADYLAATASGYKTEFRCFSEYFIDRIDSFIRYPVLIEQAAQRAGKFISFVCIGDVHHDENTIPSEILESFALPNPASINWAGVKYPQADKLDVDKNFRGLDYVSKQMYARAAELFEAPVMSEVDRARSATLAMTVFSWRASIGSRLHCAGLPKLEEFPVLDKGVLALFWKYVELEGKHELSSKRAAISATTADRLRFADADFHGRRTLKSRTKAILKRFGIQSHR